MPTSLHEKKTVCRQWTLILIFCVDVHMGLDPPPPVHLSLTPPCGRHKWMVPKHKLLHCIFQFVCFVPQNLLYAVHLKALLQLPSARVCVTLTVATYCLLLYSDIYISLLTAYAKQKRFQCISDQGKRQVLRRERETRREE